MRSGEQVAVKNIGLVAKSAMVYNFDVGGNENYFVTEEGVLVHNGYASADELKKVEDAGFTGVTATPGGSLDYAGSNALYPTKPGQTNITRIKYTGNYSADFELASQQALGQKSVPRNYVWHHLDDYIDDYNPVTGEGTMQLVHRDSHFGVSHIGGTSQYRAATGAPYVFKTW